MEITGHGDGQDEEGEREEVIGGWGPCGFRGLFLTLESARGHSEPVFSPQAMMWVIEDGGGKVSQVGGQGTLKTPSQEVNRPCRSTEMWSKRRGVTSVCVLK